MDKDKYLKAVNKIIEEQKQIVGGDVALTLARRVGDLKISEDGTAEISGDSKRALGDLVVQYSQLFGKASVVACKEVIEKISPSFSDDELPDILK